MATYIIYTILSTGLIALIWYIVFGYFSAVLFMGFKFLLKKLFKKDIESKEDYVFKLRNYSTVAVSVLLVTYFAIRLILN